MIKGHKSILIFVLKCSKLELQQVDDQEFLLFYKTSYNHYEINRILLWKKRWPFKELFIYMGG